MQSYLQYIFQSFIVKPNTSKNVQNKKYLNALNQIKHKLLQLKPVDITNYYKQFSTSFSQQKQQQHPPLIFNELNLLLAKGIIKYSPSNLTIQLSLSNLMIYQRFYKLQVLSQKYLDKNVHQFVTQWIQQALEQGVGFPILYDKNKLNKVFASSNKNVQLLSNSNTLELSRKKKIKPTKDKIQNEQNQQKTQQNELYNYHKLIYEYKSQEKHSIQQKPQNQQKKFATNSNNNKKSSKPTNNKQQGKQPLVQASQSYQQYMLNVQQLTNLLQLSKHLQITNGLIKDNKQAKLSLFQLINLKQRQSLIHSNRYHKIQQYIAQLLDQNCLLVFNLIKKYPFITEKQLISLTLMDVTESRAALNKLIEKGFVYFYYENARTIVYKQVDQNILQKNYLDMVCRAILNLHLAAQKLTQSTLVVSGQKIKAKLIQFQSQIQRLDDLLLIFGH